MRNGSFEVIILSEDGNQLEEVIISGKSYVIAMPGKEYSVKVQVHKNNQNEFPAENMRVGLYLLLYSPFFTSFLLYSYTLIFLYFYSYYRYVDGQDVQYWKRLDLSLLSNNARTVDSIFHGFKKDTNDLRSFVFATPVPTSNSSDLRNINQIPLGTIKVVIYEAIQVEGITQNTGGKYEVPGQHKVNVDGKFIHQPSVTTIGGRNINEVEKFVPLLRWKNKSEIPLITLDLYYHSPEMIRFLKLYHNTNLQLESHSQSSNENLPREKRKIHEVVDLTSELNSPPSSRQSSSSSSSPTSIPLSSHTTSLSINNLNYSISSVIENDEIEILTVVKEIPVVDMTVDDDDNPNI